MSLKVISSLSLFFLLLCFIFPCHSKELKVAISHDAPPYIINHAQSGLEVDIILQSLPGHTVSFLQMGWAEIQGAIAHGIADAETNVLGQNGKIYYSNNYIGFVNSAISKKKDNIKIEKISDLAGHHIIAWQGAHSDLGTQFAALFHPGKPLHKYYVEIGDSRKQVQEFWQRDNSVAIIDRAIFSYLSNKQGHTMDEVDIHRIFDPVSKFKMAFKEEAIRDAFNHGLSRLCETGTYVSLLKKYKVSQEANICE
ncbi:ABC transporter substrate-binding protein [uncultured Microbulbifer sp.]|uniref:substrate-binding periplasmic protein n=1 Tax=uncultured Microbulbifer sp. TaxID=348147 RepID=UPI0026140EA5|nr:ABC transporter substrate-binding protein [uncultured Microbulbifer sp.]